jgi:hypothetical protein
MAGEEPDDGVEMVALTRLHNSTRKTVPETFPSARDARPDKLAGAPFGKLAARAVAEFRV